MGLYLCIFDDENEIDGVEVGPYADFNNLRNYVVRELEGGKAGGRFSEFVLHSDSDGEWSPEVCEKLKVELAEIIELMKNRVPIQFASEWQKNIAKKVGVVPKNAFQSFIDVDGEFVLDRIYSLVNIALQHGLPILFQ